jgi:hypothetical protein
MQLGLRLRLAEDNAVLFAPLHSDPSKFDLLELIPRVPQVVFAEQSFENAEGAGAANGAAEITSQSSIFQIRREAVHDRPLVDVELIRKG